jgi:hypothetical protein
VSDLERQVRNCMTSLVRTKRGACTDAGGPTDLSPMLQIAWADGQHAIGLLDEREVIPMAVAAMRAEREGAGLPAEIAWMAFLGDVVVRHYDINDPADMAEHAAIDPDEARGYVMHQREQGDMRVEDALSIVVTDTKEVVAAMQRYIYADDGQPRFRQIQIQSETEGAIVDLLREAVALMSDDDH